MKSDARVTGISASSLAGLLQQRAAKLHGLARLKTCYRPYICPIGWVLSEIPEGARLFDVGCGSGALLYLAREIRRVTLAHGCDVDRASVTASGVFAQENDDSWRVEHLRPDQPLPRLDGYDVVTMIDVLHHIPKSRHQAFLSELAAGMSPGALLIFKDIDASKVFGRWINQLHDILLARQWVFPRSRLATAALLKSAGFTIVYHETRWSLWYPHFLVLAKKVA